VSSAAALLPPVPAPPHDPFSIVLDVRAGWRHAALENVEISPLDGALALRPLPGGWGLADDYGSFGGLALPDNVALGPECIVLLLDRAKTRLLRFDPCDCAFVPLPCIAGEGSKPRQLKDPGGMTASCGNLYVCDSGNRRVQVFGLRGLTLRSIWQQPAAANLAQPWLPVAVAADTRGRIFVGDPSNGCVHVFHITGRWLRALDGLGAIRHLTIDRQGRLYVQVQGTDLVSIVDPDTWVENHQPLEQQTSADAVKAQFGALPLKVTANGHLQLPCGEFDLDGNAVEASLESGPQYHATGKLISVALDSALFRCQWDRLELEGHFLPETGVRAYVYAAETPLPDALIAALPDEAWSACPVIDGAPLANPWDCMLRVPPGRYLWLRLDLVSQDGQGTPRIQRARLVFPRVSLRRYLPGTFGSDVQAAEFSDRFLAIFDRTFRGIESTIDWQAHFYDPLSSPADDRDRRRDFLSWLATWIGVSLDRSWPIARRRRYLKEVGKLLPFRGTLDGLKKNLQLYLGLPLTDTCADPPCGPCTTRKPPAWRPPELVLEHYRLRRWLFLGNGRLGNEARLWGDSIVNRSRLHGPGVRGNAQVGVTQLKSTQDPKRDPFWVYAHQFTVFAPASFARSPAAQRGLDRLIRAERPAHTAYQIVYVEPRFRIGIQSMIGFDSAIGCYPSGNVTLGEAKLGRATVLGGEAPNDPLSVGQRARIGTTTRLT
jgi:phage tail-like protein